MAEIKNELLDWGMFVLNSPEALKRNVAMLLKIVDEIFILGTKQPAHFVGMGKSGTAILTAIQLLKNSYYSAPSTITLVEFHPVEFPEGEIVVVDDHIKTGRTMFEIARAMSLADRNRVSIVMAMYAADHEEAIKNLFPNVKLIIH